MRAKTQVRDYASLIKGRVTGEAEKWKFNGKSFAELAKNTVLPSFTVASTQDLAKFGYTDDYFEKTAKMLEQYIDVPKEKLLADIKRNREICNFLKPLTEVGKYFI